MEHGSPGQHEVVHLDGPGSLPPTLIFNVADGFNTYSYQWDPGLAFPELSKGKATYENNYSTVSINVQAYDAVNLKYATLKGTMTCSI